jgi:hypothetical protein
MLRISAWFRFYPSRFLTQKYGFLRYLFAFEAKFCALGYAFIFDFFSFGYIAYFYASERIIATSQFN